MIKKIESISGYILSLFISKNRYINIVDDLGQHISTEGFLSTCGGRQDYDDTKKGSTKDVGPGFARNCRWFFVMTNNITHSRGFSI